MDLKKTNARLTIFLLLLFATIFSYAGNQENALVKAIQFFDEDNYTEAEQVLKKLLDEKPDHLMVNYYYGACRTENGNYGTNEIIYLLNGSTGESPLKTDYYLGVQYHAKNRWDDALKHYTRFKSKSDTEQQKQVQLSAKIQQCYEKVNPFVIENQNATVDVLPAAIPRENKIEEYNPVTTADSTLPETIIDSIETEEADSTNTASAPIGATPMVILATKPKTEPINFEVDGELTYLYSTNFRTKKGLKKYTEGKTKQKRLDEQVKEIDALRSKYGSTNSYAEKQEIGKIILAAETDNYNLQSETNKSFILAKQAEIEYWQNASTDKKSTFIKKLEEEQQANEEIEMIELDTDTTTYINTNVLLAAPEASVQMNESSDDELIYKIQLGAYSRGLPSYVENLFKKLSYLRKIENYTDEKGIVVYTTGKLTNYEDALKMQNQVRQEGIEDAFVVPYFNGKRITLKKAKEIEGK